MPRPLSSSSTRDNLKKEAKRWLRALRAGDAAARERLDRVQLRARTPLVLRDVQHALALEYGFTNWAALMTSVAAIESASGGGSSESTLQSLLRAAGLGDVARVDQILDAHPDLIDERGTLPGNSGLRTALHFGVHHEPVVRALLARGANPNIRDEGDNAFPLHFVAERENFSIIRLLVEHGAQTNAGQVDHHDLDVIGWATCFGSGTREIVDYLLAHGAVHNLPSAVAMGEAEVIRRLAAESPELVDKPMDRANQHRRPLHLAIVKRQRASLAALLDAGADVDATDGAGLTALDQAALDGVSELADVLIAHGARIDLPAAIGLQRSADVERLLQADPDSLRPGQRWGTLIVRAAARGSKDILEALLRHGASVGVRDDTSTSIDSASGYTALHAAAFHGNRAAIEVLMAHGADVTARDGKYCGTPAGWANYAGHHDCRDLILAGPIDIFDAITLDRVDRLRDILERDPPALHRPFRAYATCASRPGSQWWPDPDMTPLQWATSARKSAAVRLLISRGAELTGGGHLATSDADRVDAFLRTACLDWAVGGPERAPHSHAAARLLQRHPEIARANLFTAVVCGEIGRVEEIVREHPAAVSESGGARGWPPLLYLCNARLPHNGAWTDNAVAIARTLLDHGADPNVYYQGGDPSIHYTALTCIVGRGEEQAPVHPRARELAALLLERDAEPYDQQFLYNAFAGHASQRHLAADDFVWLLDLIYAHAIRRGRERDWQDPNWPMLDMGGYGCGAWYLLRSALTANNLRLAEWALAHGANPNAPRPSRPRAPQETLYEQAIQRGLIECAVLLARYGATPAPVAAPRDDRAQFIEACFSLDRPRVQALIAQHPKYVQDTQAPFLAADRDRADVVTLLLDLGVSPDLTEERSRRTLLHAAAYAGAAAVVRLLIARGARIDPVDAEHGTTPIYWAFWGQQPKVLDLLAPHSRDAWALVCAGKIDRLRELIAAEPDLAKMRDDNDTILFYLPDDEKAAAEIVRLLIANGADPAVTRPDGVTAEQIARARGLDEAADLLNVRSS